MKILVQLFINAVLAIGIFVGCCAVIALLLAMLRFPLLLLALLLTGWVWVKLKSLLTNQPN